MIITKEVEMKWANGIIKFYTEKGYIFTKKNDLFKVKVSDLDSGSQVKIKAQCYCCKNVYERSFKLINNALKNSITNRYCCMGCKSERMAAEIGEKQRQGLLKRGNEGYMTFIENIEKEILKHIEQYGNIDNLARRDSSLDNAIRAYDQRELYQILEDLGFNFRDYLSVTPDSYFNNFENVKKSIKLFIDEHDRFPTVGEMVDELKMSYRVVERLGGVNELRKKVGHLVEDKMIDDSGYKNRSVFEYKVAQYLIHNNIYAKRDDYPFKGKKHTCDFIVEDIDGNKYYIECWGYNEKSTNSIAVAYVKKRALKESMYKEKGLNLISVEFEDVHQINNSSLQNILKEKFSVFTDKKLKILKNIEYLDTSKLTNNDLLDIVMKYSDDIDFLPFANIVRQKEHFTVYKLILSRFGSYKAFAEYHGKKTNYGSSKNKSTINKRTNNIIPPNYTLVEDSALALSL